MGRSGTHPYQVTKRRGRDDFHVVRYFSLFLSEPDSVRRIGMAKEWDDVEVTPTADLRNRTTWKSSYRASTNSSKTFVAGSPVVPRLSLSFL